MADTRETLANLLTLIAEAHDQAFVGAGGDDPEWPIWYAERLQKLLTSLFNAPITRSEIVYLLLAAERAQQAAGDSTPWADFYADYFIQHRRSE